MTIRTALALAAATLALAACGSEPAGNSSAAAVTAAPVAAPAGTNWAETITATPDGGFLMGNPDARVKLVEYGAFSCSHCAEFSREATPALRDDYIAKGLVNWEFRPFLLSALDVPVSLLVQCQGAGPYFKLAEQVFAAQPEWMGKLQQATPAQQQALAGMAPAQVSAEIARLSGLDQFMRVRGLPAARADACLADTAAAEKLNQMRNVATERHGVTGTPAFLINGTTVPDTFDWKTLEPKLRAAIG